MSVPVTVLWVGSWRVSGGQLSEGGRLKVGGREYKLAGPAASRLPELFEAPHDVDVVSRLVIVERAGEGWAWVSGASALLAYGFKSAPQGARRVRVGGVSGRVIEGVPYSADVFVRVLTPLGARAEISARQVSPVWAPLEDVRVDESGWLAELLGEGFRGLAVRGRHAVWVDRKRIWLATVAERSVPVEVLYRRMGRLGVATGIREVRVGGPAIADVYAGDLIGTFTLPPDRALMVSLSELWRGYGPTLAMLDMLLRAVAESAVRGKRPRLTLLHTLYGLASTFPRAVSEVPAQPERALYAIAARGMVPYDREELARIKAAYTAFTTMPPHLQHKLLLAVKAGGESALFRLRGGTFELVENHLIVPTSGLLVVKDDEHDAYVTPWWMRIEDGTEWLSPELEREWVSEAIMALSAENKSVLDWAYESFTSNGLATLLVLTETSVLGPEEFTRVVAAINALRGLLRAEGKLLPTSVKEALALVAEKLRSGQIKFVRHRNLRNASLYVLDRRAMLISSTNPYSLANAVYSLLGVRAAHITLKARAREGTVGVELQPRASTLRILVEEGKTGEQATPSYLNERERRLLTRLAKLDLD